VNDYLNKTQKQIHATVYRDQAEQICEYEALKFVISKEGDKYMANTPMRCRNSIRKGYNLVKSNSPFCKYTVWQKEPNGFVFTGETRKIYSYYVVKTVLQRDFRLDSDMDNNSKMIFNESVEFIKNLMIPEEFDNWATVMNCVREQINF